MTEIKAIETQYGGYRFRSRLEARWAVFFTRMGWSWKYEHEGYRIGGERGAGSDEPLLWLPDFEVSIPGRYPKTEFYVEVKGDPSFFADGKWLEKLDWGGGPPGFFNTCGLWPQEGRKPILLLGDLPQSRKGQLFVCMIMHEQCHAGVSQNWVCVTDDASIQIDRAELLFTSLTNREMKSGMVDDSGLRDFQPFILPTTYGGDRVAEALNAARSARFEHGEQP